MRKLIILFSFIICCFIAFDSANSAITASRFPKKARTTTSIVVGKCNDLSLLIDGSLKTYKNSSDLIDYLYSTQNLSSAFRIVIGNFYRLSGVANNYPRSTLENILITQQCSTLPTNEQAACIHKGGCNMPNPSCSCGLTTDENYNCTQSCIEDYQNPAIKWTSSTSDSLCTDCDYDCKPTYSGADVYKYTENGIMKCGLACTSGCVETGYYSWNSSTNSWNTTCLPIDSGFSRYRNNQWGSITDNVCKGDSIISGSTCDLTCSSGTPDSSTCTCKDCSESTTTTNNCTSINGEWTTSGGSGSCSNWGACEFENGYTLIKCNSSNCTKTSTNPNNILQSSSISQGSSTTFETSTSNDIIRTYNISYDSTNLGCDCSYTNSCLDSNKTAYDSNGGVIDLATNPTAEITACCDTGYIYDTNSSLCIASCALESCPVSGETWNNCTQTYTIQKYKTTPETLGITWTQNTSEPCITCDWTDTTKTMSTLCPRGTVSGTTCTTSLFMTIGSVSLTRTETFPHGGTDCEPTCSINWNDLTENECDTLTDTRCTTSTTNRAVLHGYNPRRTYEYNESNCSVIQTVLYCQDGSGPDVYDSSRNLIGCCVINTTPVFDSSNNWVACCPLNTTYNATTNTCDTDTSGLCATVGASISFCGGGSSWNNNYQCTSAITSLVDRIWTWDINSNSEPCATCSYDGVGVLGLCGESNATYTYETENDNTTAITSCNQPINTTTNYQTTYTFPVDTGTGPSDNRCIITSSSSCGLNQQTYCPEDASSTDWTTCSTPGITIDETLDTNTNNTDIITWSLTDNTTTQTCSASCAINKTNFATEYSCELSTDSTTCLTDANGGNIIIYTFNDENCTATTSTMCGFDFSSCISPTPENMSQSDNSLYCDLSIDIEGSEIRQRYHFARYIDTNECRKSCVWTKQGNYKSFNAFCTSKSGTYDGEFKCTIENTLSGYNTVYTIRENLKNDNFDCMYEKTESCITSTNTTWYCNSTTGDTSTRAIDSYNLIGCCESGYYPVINTDCSMKSSTKLCCPDGTIYDSASDTCSAPCNLLGAANSCESGNWEEGSLACSTTTSVNNTAIGQTYTLNDSTSSTCEVSCAWGTSQSTLQAYCENATTGISPAGMGGTYDSENRTCSVLDSSTHKTTIYTFGADNSASCGTPTQTYSCETGYTAYDFVGNVLTTPLDTNTIESCEIPFCANITAASQNCYESDWDSNNQCRSTMSSGDYEDFQNSNISMTITWNPSGRNKWDCTSCEINLTGETQPGTVNAQTFCQNTLGGTFTLDNTTWGAPCASCTFVNSTNFEYVSAFFYSTCGPSFPAPAICILDRQTYCPEDTTSTEWSTCSTPTIVIEGESATNSNNIDVVTWNIITDNSRACSVSCSINKSNFAEAYNCTLSSDSRTCTTTGGSITTYTFNDTDCSVESETSTICSTIPAYSSDPYSCESDWNNGQCIDSNPQGGSFSDLSVLWTWTDTNTALPCSTCEYQGISTLCSGATCYNSSNTEVLCSASDIASCRAINANANYATIYSFNKTAGTTENEPTCVPTKSSSCILNRKTTCTIPTGNTSCIETGTLTYNYNGQTVYLGTESTFEDTGVSCGETCLWEKSFEIETYCPTSSDYTQTFFDNSDGSYGSVCTLNYGTIGTVILGQTQTFISGGNTCSATCEITGWDNLSATLCDQGLTSNTCSISVSPNTGITNSKNLVKTYRYNETGCAITTETSCPEGTTAGYNNTLTTELEACCVSGTSYNSINQSCESNCSKLATTYCGTGAIWQEVEGETYQQCLINDSNSNIGQTYTLTNPTETSCSVSCEWNAGDIQTLCGLETTPAPVNNQYTCATTNTATNYQTLYTFTNGEACAQNTKSSCTLLASSYCESDSVWSKSNNCLTTLAITDSNNTTTNTQDNYVTWTLSNNSANQTCSVSCDINMTAFATAYNCTLDNQNNFEASSYCQTAPDENGDTTLYTFNTSSCTASSSSANMCLFDFSVCETPNQSTMNQTLDFNNCSRTQIVDGTTTGLTVNYKYSRIQKDTTCVRLCHWDSDSFDSFCSGDGGTEGYTQTGVTCTKTRNAISVVYLFTQNTDGSECQSTKNEFCKSTTDTAFDNNGNVLSTDPTTGYVPYGETIAACCPSGTKYSPANGSCK